MHTLSYFVALIFQCCWGRCSFSNFPEFFFYLRFPLLFSKIFPSLSKKTPANISTSVFLFISETCLEQQYELWDSSVLYCDRSLRRNILGQPWSGFLLVLDWAVLLAMGLVQFYHHKCVISSPKHCFPPKTISPSGSLFPHFICDTSNRVVMVLVLGDILANICLL